VKVTKDTLDIAKSIVTRLEPDEFEDQYEAAMVDLTRAVPTMALRRSVDQEAAAAKAPSAKEAG
jgi:non-homologous end joining protein Ku